ncbi:MAG: hypothetical protein ACTTJ3_09380, partial [Treponema sp.]
MKQKSLFRSGVSSLLMGATFLMLFGMFSCNTANNGDETGKQKDKKKSEITLNFSHTPAEGGTLEAKIGQTSKNNGVKIEKNASTIVTFTAKAKQGYKIGKWAGVIEGENEGKETATANAGANINVTVTFVKENEKKDIESVSFDTPVVTSTPKTGNKEQVVVFNVTHKEFDVPTPAKYIDAVIMRVDGKDFPENAKIKIKYELTLKGQTTALSAIESNEYTVPAGKKTIYGSEIFSGSVKHTQLNANHVGCKEKYTITIELPMDETKDIEVKNVSALFTSETATDVEKSLGETTFTIKGVKRLEEVTFKGIETNEDDTKPAERKVEFKVEYPADFYAETDEYIDAVITLGDGTKDFPVGTKIKTTYKLGAGTPSTPVDYEVQANTKKIFGHTLFGTGVKRTKLNTSHIGATETYSITITFPETAAEDEYTFKVESALFADENTEDVKKSLKKQGIPLRGCELSSLTYTTTKACANVAGDATKAKKEFEYTIKYPKFAMPAYPQFIDTIIKLEGGKKFPKGTKITMTFNNGAASPVYEVTEESGVALLFGSLIAGQEERSGLNADLKEATQTFKLLIELPAEVNEEKYGVLIQTAVFKKNKVSEDPDPVRFIHTAHKIEVSGYGRD